MKRSEILKVIEGLYNLELNLYPKNNPSDTFAENLLCHLEDKGMLPPTITVLENQYNRQEGTYGFEVNEWEEENDDI